MVMPTSGRPYNPEEDALPPFYSSTFVMTMCLVVFGFLCSKHTKNIASSSDNKPPHGNKTPHLFCRDTCEKFAHAKTVHALCCPLKIKAKLPFLQDTTTGSKSMCLLPSTNDDVLMSLPLAVRETRAFSTLHII